MKAIDIKDKYRVDQNKDVYSDDDAYRAEGTGSYSDEYVKWLEEKLANKDELIKAIIHGHRYAIAGTSLEKTIEKYESNK